MAIRDDLVQKWYLPILIGIIGNTIFQFILIIIAPWESFSPFQIFLYLFIFFSIIISYTEIINYLGNRANIKKTIENKTRSNRKIYFNKPYTYYRIAIRRLLRMISRILGEDDFSKSSWTIRSFDRCLLLALAYPLFFALFLWVVDSESAGKVAWAIGLPRSPSIWLSIALAVSLAFPIIVATAKLVSLTTIFSKPNFAIETKIFIQDAEFNTQIEENNNKFPAIVSFVSLSLLIPIYFIGRFTDAFTSIDISQAAIFLFPTILIIVVTSIKRESFGFGSSALSACVLLSFAVNGINSPAGENYFAAPFTFIILISFMLPIIYNHIGDQLSIIKLLIAPVFPALFLIILLLATPLIINGYTHATNSTISIMYLLPIVSIVNAFFDWLSIGLTRYLLRYGLERGGLWPLFLGVFDFCLALVILIALCFVMLMSASLFVASFENFKYLQPTELSKIIGPMQNSGQGLDRSAAWLILIVFSSLIPSFVNILIGVISFLNLSEIFARKLSQFERNILRDDVVGNVTAIVLKSMPTGFAISLSMFVFYYMLMLIVKFIIPNFAARLFAILP